MSIIPSSWHETWNDFMIDDIKSDLQEIENKIGKEFVPLPQNVLKFLQFDLSKIKCIWVGQDPYYTLYDNNKPVANGSAFWPDDLRNWSDKFSQKSLQNIVRAIYAAHNNISTYSAIPKYSEVKKYIEDGSFPIKQPYEWFSSIENQGVLLLNTYFTTIPGKGNEHRLIWTEFSTKLIKYIAKNTNAVWFLWGAEAQSKKALLSPKTKTYCSNHPTFCSEKYETDFLKNMCFKETSHLINWLG